MSILCLKCGYSITEPICASCVINEIRIWLYEQKLERYIFKKINNELKFLLNRVESIEYILSPSRNRWKETRMKCIRCRGEMSLMCFYCVSNQAGQIMKFNLNDEETLENFQESFNMKPYDYGLKEEIDSELLL